ncbi:MAG: hypothetical protein JWN38_1008 [Candidatus Saccharibacteria bacterium]|nr:hypothetical protein [Candidatus Saccharibacteria bacterium]
MNPPNKKLGTSLSDGPKLFFGALKTWQGLLGVALMVVLAIILPQNLKAFGALVFGVPLLAAGMKTSVKKISQAQLASVQSQPAAAGWQTACFVQADGIAPFPAKWETGQISLDNGALLWRQNTIFRKADSLTIDLTQQQLQVIQTRAVAAGESLHIKANAFMVLVCQSQVGGQVLLAVPQDFVGLVSGVLSSNKEA